MKTTSRERILSVASLMAQARGYNGLNFRDLAEGVGIKAASIYHYFPSKADLGAAVARRYWEDSAATLETLSVESASPARALHRYPETFRWALESSNRICLCSFMAAEYDDLPDPVKHEVLTFSEVNISWLSRMLLASGTVKSQRCPSRAQAIFAAISGAQLIAKSRSDVAVYDDVIKSYRTAGLLPR